MEQYENRTQIQYKPILVRSTTVPLKEFEEEIINRLVGINKKVGVKGGFARELLRYHLGLSSQINYAKLIDLDIVVFDTPSNESQKRIEKRNEIADSSQYFEPKDIEICDSGDEGLRHYFRTRDVTMNELVMLRNGENLVFLHTDECINDLRERVIRPSIHCSHTGLNEVWLQQGKTKVLSPPLIGRCIYRVIKGDGDKIVSTNIRFPESVRSLTVDELFKIIKRFSGHSNLLNDCRRLYKGFGISDENLEKVFAKIYDPTVKKSRGDITSEVVEIMLSERRTKYEQWLQAADDNQKVVAEVKLAV